MSLKHYIFIPNQFTFIMIANLTRFSFVNNTHLFVNCYSFDTPGSVTVTESG